MTPTALLLVILVVFLGALVSQAVRVEVTALATIAALSLTGVLAPSDALSGFSSAATIAVGALLVLSAGVERSGAMDLLATSIARFGGRSERRVLAALLAPVALLSAFLNNTPVVALMIPVALALGRRTGLPPSRMLIPVSYVSILGGTCTLIGTSTNILVDSLHRQQGGAGFGMFEFTGLGLLYLMAGGTYVLVAGPRLLPRGGAAGVEGLTAGRGDYVAVVSVPERSALAGETLGAALRGSEDVAVLQVVRREVPHMLPDPAFRLEAGDVVLIEGSALAIHGVVERDGIEPGHGAGASGAPPIAPHLAAAVLAGDLARIGPEERRRLFEDEPPEPPAAGPEPIRRADLRIVEAVVTPGSAFRQRRVQDLGLGRRFRMQVLALRRHGRHHRYDLRSLRIQAGDVLLVQGEPTSLRALQDEGDLLLLEGTERGLPGGRKGPVAVAILAAVIALASAGIAPVAVLGLAGAALMILTGCLDTREATRALDPSVLLLIAASIPLGVAMEQVGLAEEIAGAIGRLGSGGDVYLLVGIVYLATSVLTEVVSNNATAVLLVPIVAKVSEQVGVDAKPLLVAVAFGASASFATPIGYQTNTLVMGPGGYSFRDYLRIGLPLNLILWFTATALIPRFWPG